MKRALKQCWAILQRWTWALFLAVTIVLATHGDAVGSAIWGMCAGLEFADRFRAEPRPRNEIRLGLTADEAQRLRDEILDERRRA